MPICLKYICPVSRFRDILRRIRVLESVHWIRGFEMPTKNKFFSEIFLLITYRRYIYNILQKDKSLRSHKTVEIKVFLYYLVYCRRTGSVQIITEPDPRAPKAYGSYGSRSGSGILYLSYYYFFHNLRAARVIGCLQYCSDKDLGSRMQGRSCRSSIAFLSADTWKEVLIPERKC